MPDVEQWLGTYRSDQAATPRQRRILLRVALVVVALCLGNLAYALIAGGGGGGGGAELVALLPAMLVWLPLGALNVVTVRRSPRTEVSAAGVWARTDVFAARGVGWEEVRGVELAGRFDLQPHAVLLDGSRLELPGVPADVADHLRAAVAATRDDPPPPPPPRPARHPDDDLGWDGPFRRG